MLNEWKEFRAYTEPVTYTAAGKRDTTYMGRFTFDTLMEHHTYEVIAVFTTTASKGQGFNYHHFIDADSPEEFDEYIADCKIRALYDTGVTATYGDKLITLSTCEYSQKNGRFAVVAKRIS